MKEQMRRAMETEGVKRVWWEGDSFCVETGLGNVWKVHHVAPTDVAANGPDWSKVVVEAPAP